MNYAKAIIFVFSFVNALIFFLYKKGTELEFT